MYDRFRQSQRYPSINMLVLLFHFSLIPLQEGKKCIPLCKVSTVEELKPTEQTDMQMLRHASGGFLFLDSLFFQIQRDELPMLVCCVDGKGCDPFLITLVYTFYSIGLLSVQPWQQEGS